MKGLVKCLAFCFIVCLIAAVFAINPFAEEEDKWAFLPFDKELYYGRNQLAKLENGEAMVAAYDAVLFGVQDGEPEILLNEKSSVDDIVLTCSEMDTVFLAHRYDNPQQFWVEGYGYRVYADQTVRSAVISYNAELNTDEAKKEFNDSVDSFIASCNVDSSMSEYEIEKIYHDALVDKLTYIETANCRNVYGAFVEGNAVCEGYAESFQYLLNLSGIQAHGVTGNANGPHEWTLVRIDGKYSYVDVTWDDGGTRRYYGYLNMTEQMLLDEGRVFEERGYPLPECDYTEGHYYNNAGYAGRNFKTTPSVQNAVTQIKHYGEARFFYNGSGSFNFADFKKWAEDNASEIGRLLGLNGFGYSLGGKNREFVLEISGVEKQPLPTHTVLPSLNTVLSDTSFSVTSGESVGNVVKLPSKTEGLYTSEAEAIDVVNNARVSFVSSSGVLGTGSEISIDGENAKIVVMGDVDGDGCVTVFDAMMIKKAYEGQRSEDMFGEGMELNAFAADINSDSVFDLNDARKLLKHVAGSEIIE